MSVDRPRLTVVLVDDLVTAPASPWLAGRPALDWLLDTVQALVPDVVVAAAADTTALRERLSQRPGLAAGMARTTAPVEDQSVVTLFVACSMPLVLPATLRRALRLLAGTADGGQPVGAVLLEPTRQPPWWEEADAHRAESVLALAGAAPAECLRRPGAGGTLDAVRAGGKAVVTTPLNPTESLSLNDPLDRTRAELAVYQRIAAGWIASGVIIEDPATTRIDATVRLGDGVRIRPNTELVGATVIGAGTRVGPTTTIRDAQVGRDCQIQYAVCQQVEIGDGANVGPFCWLRSGTKLGARGRAGAFVELADSVIGEGTSIPHLGGLFSADVGRDCNIAGMSAPANFNGATKHRVQIGDGVSIGAGNILVAPVSIGDGSATAAGSVITDDVPDGALAMARSAQRNINGWAAAQRRRR